MFGKVALRAVVYGLLALVLFLGYQHVVLYIQGIANNPFQTIYRVKRVEESKRVPLKKGEKYQTTSCVPLRHISEQTQTPNVEPELKPKDLLLDRFAVPPSLQDRVAEVRLSPEGVPSLTLVDDPSFLALGRLRELGINAGHRLEDLQNLSPQDNWYIELRYTQDLLRVGPVMTKLSTGAGYSVRTGTYVDVNLGAAVRF